MALIKCKDCGKEFSTDATACIHCGAKPPEQVPEQQKSGCLGFVALAVVFLIVAIVMTGGKTSNDTQGKNPQDYVLSMCMSFTKDSLHDPSSADFDYPYPHSTNLGDNKYSMILPLRAKNGFGALRHFAVECVVKFNGGDSWSLVKLKEIN